MNFDTADCGVTSLLKKGDRYPFYDPDGNGNVTELTNDNGTVVASYRYTAFGQLRSSSGSAAEENPYRFSTKPYDDVSGTYYYGFRYYDPGLGRWLNRDPLGEDGGVNVYAFVGNDSVNQRDLLGLKLETFLFVSYFTESCVPALSVSFKAPNRLLEYVQRLLGTASFIAGLMGENYKTDTEEISIPDCYIRNRQLDTQSYELLSWRISLDNFPYEISVCGNVKETIEWSWIPDPYDECCN